MYKHESWTLDKTTWDKIEVLWGKYWWITWELGEPYRNMMRTCSEHIGDKEKKQKNNFIHLTPKRKIFGPIMSACWAFSLVGMKLISKTICHHFWPELMAGAQTMVNSHHIHHLSYSLLLFIRWGASQVLFFWFFAMSQFDWPIMQKRTKLLRFP